MQGSTAVLLIVLTPLFSAFIPFDTQRASAQAGQAKHVSHMAVETHEDVCMGLSSAECCAQSLEVAVFRATGDQIPKAAKTPVRLSCSDPTAVVPEGACRSIAMARGFGAKDVGDLCVSATLAKRCDGANTCKTCVRELAKLKFQNPERACLAATYVTPPADATKVIQLRDEREDANKPPVGEGGNTFEIHKRTVVR
jgi:hypothetical protein